MYIRPKNGATVTIFAPYDCENHCPFCINKKDYQNNPTFDLNNVINSMKIMDEITPDCDFVVTGGEPFANLEALEEILDFIKILNAYSKCVGRKGHKVFINTTLPVKKYTRWEIVDFINKHSGVITGLNVSRHIVPFVEECDDNIFYFIKVPVRINCVLYGNLSTEYAPDLLKRFKEYECIIGYQFREDYTKVKIDNLFNYKNDTLTTLLIIFNIDFTDTKITESTFRWNCEFLPGVSYHRTLPYSKIISDNFVDYEINDVIIDPRGKILDDWNDYGKELNLEMYKNAKEKEN